MGAGSSSKIEGASTDHPSGLPPTVVSPASISATDSTKTTAPSPWEPVSSMPRYSWVRSTSGFQETSKNDAGSPAPSRADIRTALPSEPEKSPSPFGLRSKMRVSSELTTI